MEDVKPVHRFVNRVLIRSLVREILHQTNDLILYSHIGFLTLQVFWITPATGESASGLLLERCLPSNKQLQASS